MPWCPECNAEYIRGFTECSDCGCPLVEDKQQEQESGDVNEPAHLMTALNEYEARGIKTFLESEGIPVLFVHKGLGGQLTVIMGTSPGEVDIMIPKSCISRAQALLESSVESLKDSEVNDIDDSEYDDLEGDDQADMDEETYENETPVSYEDGSPQDSQLHAYPESSGTALLLRIVFLIGVIGILFFLISRIF